MPGVGTAHSPSMTRGPAVCLRIPARQGGAAGAVPGCRARGTAGGQAPRPGRAMGQRKVHAGAPQGPSRLRVQGALLRRDRSLAGAAASRACRGGGWGTHACAGGVTRRARPETPLGVCRAWRRPSSWSGWKTRCWRCRACWQTGIPRPSDPVRPRPRWPGRGGFVKGLTPALSTSPRLPCCRHFTVAVPPVCDQHRAGAVDVGTKPVDVHGSRVQASTPPCRAALRGSAGGEGGRVSVSSGRQAMGQLGDALDACSRAPFPGRANPSVASDAMPAPPRPPFPSSARGTS